MAGNIINCVVESTVTKGLVARINGIGTNIKLPLALTATDGTTASAHNNVGIFLASGVSGDVVPVQVDGVCDIAIAGASITIGALVTTGAAGKLAAGASGDRCIGRVIRGKGSTGATADGAECSILLCGNLGIA